MKFKGTKGEWTVIYDRFEGYGVIVPDNKIGTFFVANQINQGKDDGMSDAKLIAAAPGLLKALQDLLNVDEIDVHLKYKLEINAQKAINKALN